MPVDWVDFKSIKGKASMETVLSHYDVRLRRVGANEFRGKCPLPTHSSSSSNNSFSVNFGRNAWSCQSASCIAARSGRVGGNVFDFVAEMEHCSIREAALHLQHSLAENQILALAYREPGSRSLHDQKIGLYLSPAQHRPPASLCGIAWTQ
jgi:DNA primase